METAAAGDVSGAAESAADCSARVSAMNRSACVSAAVAAGIGYWASNVSAASITIARASVVAAAIIAAVAVASAPSIPGARADEEAAGEPGWPVVAIGRAGVRVVAVVAIGAHWRSITVSPIDRASNSDAD
jgi:hypothetical protein